MGHAIQTVALGGFLLLLLACAVKMSRSIREG
jgi:hypothetical protein